MSKQCQYLILFFAFSFMLNQSCRKEIDIVSNEQGTLVSTANSNNEKGLRMIYVSNADQLYAALNDVDNAGSAVVLRPGTYTLNASFPNAGRIELQKDMELRGQAADARVVIIDGSSLPASSFLLTAPQNFPGLLRTGVIRVGNGSNNIEWLTILGQPTSNAYSVIETDLITTAITHVRVAHCIITGGQIGINIRNRESTSNGRVIEAEILNNELTGNLAGFGQGIGVFNARNVTGGIIRAKLTGNYVHQNRIGIRAFNVVSNNCRIEVKSNGDRFEENGAGLALLGAFNEYPDFTANDNYVSFEAHGTTISGNAGIPAPPSGTAQVLSGGVMAIGGMVSVNSLPGTTSNNKLNVSFWGCSFYDNVAPGDIKSFGARSTYPSTNPAGTNNVVNIHLNGISANATVNAISSIPFDQSATNVVNVFKN